METDPTRGPQDGGRSPFQLGETGSAAGLAATGERPLPPGRFLDTARLLRLRSSRRYRWVVALASRLLGVPAPGLADLFHTGSAFEQRTPVRNLTLDRMVQILQAFYGENESSRGAQAHTLLSDWWLDRAVSHLHRLALQAQAHAADTEAREACTAIALVLRDHFKEEIASGRHHGRNLGDVVGTYLREYQDLRRAAKAGGKE